MIKWKCKAHVEKQVEKYVKKKPVSKAKKSLKMLQWMKMDSNELKWVRQVGLENQFDLKWTTPREDLLRNFLGT
jgi:hypothetical protein